MTDLIVIPPVTTMTTVMAQGVFDIIHLGHLHYLQKSAELGDELVVVVARDARVAGKKDLQFTEEERRELLEGLKPVDRAVLGAEGDIYETVRGIDPDVITLGYDQNHDEEDVKNMAERATGHAVKVVRMGQKTGYSSSSIRDN